MKNKIWVVIPAFNEEKYLDSVLKKLKRYWENIIIVDDGSSDKTSVIAEKYTSHVLVHTVNLGKGAALKTGCEYAFREKGTTGVIFFDADDQHDSKLVPKIAEQLRHFPVVLGVRSFNNEMPLIRILFNRFSSVIILMFFGKYIPDIPSGFKALSRFAYKKVRWQSSDYLVEMEIAARVAQFDLPFAIVPIPTIYHDLDRGMTVLDILHMAGKILSWKISK